MIFVTVGAQMPFDRLVRAVDQWASSRERSDVFAQIGLTDYRPQSMGFTPFMDPPEFRNKVESADVVVAHAGMGTILTALELGKPILVMPRRGDLRETRNDHQIATAKRFLAQGRIFVAFDEESLAEKLDYLDKLRPAELIGAHASPAMIAALRAFIEGKGLLLPSADSAVAEPLRVGKSVPIRWQHSPAEGIPLDGRWLAHPGAVGTTYASPHIKSRVSAMILLGGRLRPTDLGRRIGRSRLDLPIDAGRSLLVFWRDEAISLADAWCSKHLKMRVLLDQASPNPTIPPSAPGVTLALERDETEFRGTGGVLRDACAEYDDEDWVLVANAAQLLFTPLKSLADRMAEAGGEINVVHDSEGIPNGLILLRCGVLRAISDIGYHDMKEQVIPALAKRHRIKVVSTEGLTSRPIHSLKDYTEALRSYHSSHGRNGPGPESERWQSQFSIREPGVAVAPTAVLHDAVILQGAVVEKGAVVVRSLVGQGARVRAGQKVFDQIVI